MEGFKAFKYYTALKLHFTNKAYNVFKHKGHVKGTYDSYMRRNDHTLFDRLGHRFKDDRTFIQYIASNFMYGNPDVVYDDSDAMSYYTEFIRRRQAITQVFKDDLAKLEQKLASNSEYKLFETGNKLPLILSLYLNKTITLETVRILDDMTGFLDNLSNDSQLDLLFGPELLRLQKAKGFIKYDPEKVKQPYQSFLEDLKGINHGTHASV